jgi:hypothetical protein
MADPLAAQSKVDVATRSPSGADLVSLLLLILFGFGIWAVVERGFTKLLGIREPTEQGFLDAREVTRQKAQLTDVQNEIAEIQKYLNAARLDEIKQKAAVQSYVLTYPPLQDAPSPANVAPETVRAYTETQRQSRSASSVVNSLEELLRDRNERREVLNAGIEYNTEVAQSDFRDAHDRYLILKRGGTFVVTVIIVAVLLWLVRVVLWILAKKRMSTVEGFRPFALALAALVLLFAYDQFSYPGAAFVGLLLLLLLLRRIKWPLRTNVPVK